MHGSGSKQAFVDDILRALREHTPITCVDNPFQRFDFEPLPAGAAYGRTRAMLKIQDGCNNFCTYCVIPYTRGRIRSLPLDEMAHQAAHLAAEGYRELVLTGIEIASYGRDLPGELTLADAVETVAAAPRLSGADGHHGGLLPPCRRDRAGLSAFSSLAAKRVRPHACAHEP